MSDEVPIVNDFNKDWGKFIQVYVKGQPYMWFGPGKFLHGHIFNDLLNKLEISFESMKEHYCDETIQIPLIKGKDYELVGAGRVIEMSEKIKLFDKSASYSIGPNKKHAEKISELTGLEIIVKQD